MKRRQNGGKYFPSSNGRMVDDRTYKKRAELAQQAYAGLLTCVESLEEVEKSPQLLLPAAAKCPVELHQALILRTSRLGQHQFRGKERPLPVQHFQIRRGASPVAHDG